MQNLGYIAKRRVASARTQPPEDTPPSSPTGGTPRQNRDHALVRSLRDVYPSLMPIASVNADNTFYSELADVLQRCVSPPELHLDLAGAHANFVRQMPVSVWRLLGERARETCGAGIESVYLRGELADGGEHIVDGLKELGAGYVEVTAPTHSDTIDLRNRHSDEAASNWQQYRFLNLTVRFADQQSGLKHIFVPDRAQVKGMGSDAQDVMVHFTDSKGRVLRSAALSEASTVSSLTAGDYDTRAAFINAASLSLPHLDALERDQLFTALLEGIQHCRLDLSEWTGENAAAVRDLGKDAWDVFMKDPHTAGLTSVIQKSDITGSAPEATNGADRVDRALPPGLRQLPALDLNQPYRNYRREFQTACQSHPELQQLLGPGRVGPLFDTLVARIRGTTLDLSDMVGPEAALLLALPDDVWQIIREHPAAGDLITIVSPDPDQSAPVGDSGGGGNARTAFLMALSLIPQEAAEELFDCLVECIHGPVLDLSEWREDAATVVQLLPWRAWQALKAYPQGEHPQLSAVLVSDELASLDPELHGLTQIGPSASGTPDQKQDAKQYEAFAAACAPLPGALKALLPPQNFEPLFDRLLGLVRGPVLDLSPCVGGVARVLHDLPADAFAALLGHSKAAAVTLILTNRELQHRGPLNVRGVKQIPVG